MSAYLGGYPVTQTIQLVDSAGEQISAIGADYRLVDHAGNELVAKVALDTFIEGDTQVTIDIDGTLNTLTPPNTREIRVIELYLTTDVGTIKLEKDYIIEAEQVLVEAVNSFQQYTMATMVAMDIPGIANWNSATKHERITALIRARQNIGQLRFRYVFDAYQNIVDNTLGVADLTLATPAQWAAFPKQFKEALRRAQVLEADYLLMPDDSMAALRRDGIMSMTVGESKQFFRPTKSIEGPVCKRAMRELTKWVLSRHRISRT